MSFILGLTGGIGMGKSTTSAMLRDLGVEIWDADAAVHRLYAPNGAATGPIEKAFPGTLDGSGAVQRKVLRAHLAANPTDIERLNGIVHPLVRADREAFLASARSDIVVLDVPLLFEGGLDARCDAVLVVSVPAHIQRQRVLARGLTTSELDLILSRQVSDPDRRSRADFVIETLDMENARSEVAKIVGKIRAGWRRDA